MFTILTMQIQKHLWPLCAVMGILLTSAFTLTVRAPMAHAATVAKEGAKVSIVNFAFTPAEIFGVQVSGFLAWWLWRTMYLINS